MTAHPLPVGARVRHRRQLWPAALSEGTATILEVAAPADWHNGRYLVLTTENRQRSAGPDNPPSSEAWWDYSEAELADETLPMPKDDVVYHGRIRSGGGAVAVAPLDASWVRPLPHEVRHSPTGVHWGYAGSGPADLALSLLVDAVGGQDAACTDRAHAGGAMCQRADCEDGVRELPYMDFKRQFVEGLGEEWTMRRSEILVWLESQHLAPRRPA